MEPLISIRADRGDAGFEPGGLIRFACQVDAAPTDPVTAIEVSVLWRTEGKGDENLGVHFFERMTHGEDAESELLALRRFEARLPRSPLSYEGVILKIRWAIRVRVFMRSGKDFHFDFPFQLGRLAAAHEVEDEHELVDRALREGG